MKKHFSFLGLAALLTAAALTSCQKEEWEMDSPSESENDLELADDGTRATYSTSASNLKLEDSKYIANPEKGLYKHYDIYFDKSLAQKYKDAIEVRSDGKGYPRVDYYTFGFKEGTLVLLQFYLIDFRTTKLSDEALSRIKKIFNNVRTAKKKAIVRFSYSREHGSDLAYDSSFNRDASYDRVLSHIGQLEPILQGNEDIIYLLQGGFIGTYGEWYYISESDYVYDNLSINKYGFHNRKEIITRMLGAVPNRMVALRTPEFKRRYLNSKSDYLYDLYSYKSLSQPNASGNANYRLSFYNDVFMVDNGQMQGTFPTTLDDDMWKSQSKCLACGGETANNRSTKDYMYNENPVTWINKYHMSYLNRRSSADVDKKTGVVTYSSRLYYKWMEAGKEPAIANALGYRLWLNKYQMSGNYSTKKSSTQNATIVFSIKNDGAAPVIYKRPMKLVLMRNNKVIQELASTTGSCQIDGKSNYIWFTTNNANTTQHGTDIDKDLADLRKIPSVASKYMTCKVRFPKNLQTGDCIALWMPDQNSDLRSVSDYSIHLCNKETDGFSWNNGYNIIYKFK